MSKPNRYEIRIAGFGGQGVVTIGKILGIAFSVHDRKNSVNTQSYGPESRGGACRSEVVVSDSEINYPYVRKADVFIALSQIALDTYISDLKPGGILVVDPNSVESVPAKDLYRIYEVPTVEISYKIGDLKYQNCVALGALYPLIKDLLKKSSLQKAIEESVPPKTREINLTAFESGLEYIEAHYPKKD